MIKIHNLDKYFNKNKNNEIHVINDISLTLPKSGLVVLLGPSGSGKTTLLNVLGGLDKTQSGLIDFDGEEIRGYKSKTWDHIRNEHIGYVFQNYNLLNNQTVYDNIALSLRMVGITDKEEIDTRVDYLLDNMGMINYRRRKAANLSGGQQQRVAIARALAKNPKVIIADEPTGNLDSKNTFDIMNILRAISQTKLVVLVTHEENIANLYADRIIRLRDGRIVEDVQNKSVGGVDVQLETDIYLKDMHKLAQYEAANTSYEIYSDEETKANFGVKLIVRNKTLYVQVENDQFTRVNLLEKDSEISVYDDHFKGQEIEEFSETEFDLTKVIDESKRKPGLSVIPLKEALRLGFKRFSNVTRMKAFQYILFFLNAAVIGIALSLLFNAYTVDDVDFLSQPKNLMDINITDQDYDDMKEFLTDDSIDEMRLINQINSNLKLPKIYQTNGNTVSFSYPPVYAEYMNESKIIHGRAVENQNEVVISEHYAKELMKNWIFESLGIQSAKDLLTLNLEYQLNGLGEQHTVEVAIVGIVDVDDVAFYAKEETIWMMYTKNAVYEVYEDKITIDKGAVSTSYTKFMRMDKDNSIDDLSVYSYESDGRTWDLEATYTSTDETVPGLLWRLEVLKEQRYTDEISSVGSVFQFFVNDKDDAAVVFKNDGLTPKYSYDTNRKDFTDNKILESLGYIMFAGVFLGAAFIGTFFIMRSSLLSRIYEVSVYRALGAPKKDLRRIFLIESLILTVFTSLLGYLAMSYVLIRLQVMTEGYFEVVKVTPLSFTSGLLIVLLVNVLSGVWPVSSLLRRTPAEIISKYDF